MLEICGFNWVQWSDWLSSVYSGCAVIPIAVCMLMQMTVKTLETDATKAGSRLTSRLLEV